MAGCGLPIVRQERFNVARGECVVLDGLSGVGKSSILKIVFGNCRPDGGRTLLADRDAFLDIAGASPGAMISARRRIIAYVSPCASFRACLPSTSSLPQRERAASRRQRLWRLPPATFSGGEQQRVNITRGFAGDHSLRILDEPTASLDAENRDAVVELIAERRANGAGFSAIFHDEDVRPPPTAWPEWSGCQQGAGRGDRPSRSRRDRSWPPRRFAARGDARRRAGRPRRLAGRAPRRLI
jgi:alpha-D-ribose 1-methylphosphonate 5-triphosphate synthase subunit PhnL